MNGVRAVLGNPEVMMDCNIYSVIFDFRGNRLWLASGGVPAARGVCRGCPLFN